MTIRQAYEASGMTIKEIAECLRVPQRTLQDWIYEKRTPKQKDIADKVLAMSILTAEGRQSLIIESQDWDTVMREYKLETARRLSNVGSYGDSFSQSLRRIPETCISQLSAQSLAELIDAIHQAYQDGKKDGA